MRFRFTIRDLLWLTLVVALALAWWVDRSNLIRAVASWREMVDHQDDTVRGLQEYFHKKHPNEPIDWAELREIRRQESH
jgi:hypothetical protein